MGRRIKISHCLGCSMCVQVCPDIFIIQEDGKSHNRMGDDCEVPEDNINGVIRAMEVCPIAAIQLVESRMK